ncbi:MAG: hypothetical protein H6669_01625 [Ardenticatenaceae bacterium]|nr:hypothetical protein [Ardenticatenaceae bacterium]
MREKPVTYHASRNSRTLGTNNDSPNLVLGIDTGGTYTDGILLEYETRRVLAAHKSLTTKRDFAIGIENVIEGIHISDPAAIRMVSISTTLATNAIAEGKSKRVALLLIGYDPELIANFKMAARFATPHYAYFDGGTICILAVNNSSIYPPSWPK